MIKRSNIGKLPEVKEFREAFSQRAENLQKLKMARYYPFMAWRSEEQDKPRLYVFAKEDQDVSYNDIQKLFACKGNWVVMDGEVRTTQRLEQTDEWLRGSSA